MRLKFEKDKRDTSRENYKVIVDYTGLGFITLFQGLWALEIRWAGEDYSSDWPSLEQAQNEVRRIVGK